MASGCSRLLVMALILGASVGCGPRRPTLGKVAGTVRFDGKPVADGAIVFEVPGNRPASGKIVAGALRDVTTFDVGDGVPVGTAHVAIHAFATPAAKPKPAVSPMRNGDDETFDPKGYMAGPPSLIPARYNDPASSEIAVTIEPGDNTVNLDLKP